AAAPGIATGGTTRRTVRRRIPQCAVAPDAAPRARRSHPRTTARPPRARGVSSRPRALARLGGPRRDPRRRRRLRPAPRAPAPPPARARRARRQARGRAPAPRAAARGPAPAPGRGPAPPPPLAFDARHGLLRDDAHLLRERGAAPRPRIHDDRGGHPRPSSPP